MSLPTRAILVLVTGAALFAAPVRVAAQSWNKIRYQAGTLKPKVNPFDWNTTLTIAADGVELSFEGRSQLKIASQRVVTLSCGDTAYRRISEETSTGSSSNPVPLFGIARGSTEHLFGVEFRNMDGSVGAVLLMVQRDSYNAVVKAVSDVTGLRPLGAR